MRTRLASVLLLAIVAGACSTAGSGSGEPRRNRNHLTAEELVAVDGFTAWEAVQRLRPMWMRPRGTGHYPSLFVDESPYGDMEGLHRFRVSDIEEMRYIDGTDATTRYGGQYQGGVILVTMKSRDIRPGAATQPRNPG